jgi:putative SOS response-associated peptidase YedK
VKERLQRFLATTADPWRLARQVKEFDSLQRDGFYEWQAAGKKKQPYFFQLREQGLFALQPVHDRMPVILSTEGYERWLGPDQGGGVLERET